MAQAHLEGEALQGPFSLWRAQRDGDRSTSWYIVTLVMFPRFGAAGSCESLAGRRWALPCPQGGQAEAVVLGWRKV